MNDSMLKNIVFPVVIRSAMAFVSRQISELPDMSEISDVHEKIEICAKRAVLFSARCAFETSLSYFNMSMFDASRRKYRCAVRYLYSVDGGVVLWHTGTNRKKLRCQCV